MMLLVLWFETTLLLTRIYTTFVNDFRVLQGHNCLLANHLDFTNNSFKRSYYLLKWIATSLYDRNMFEQQTIKLENGLEIRLTVATPQVSAILENM